MVFTTNQALILRLGLAGFISAADNWVISPLLPAIASGLQVSIFQAGILLTAYLIPYGVMQPVYGYLSDRWGKRKILQRIILGLAMGTVGCAVADSLWLLCLWRFFTGFFAAGIIAVSLALIGDTVAVQERQSSVALFGGIVFLGQGISAGLGGILAEYVGWRLLFILFALLALGAALLIRNLPSGNKNFQNHNFFAEVKRVAGSPLGKKIFPLSFLSGFLLLGIYSYLGAFLHDEVGLNYVQVGMVIMIFGISCFLGGREVGRLGGKMGYENAMIVGAGLAALPPLFFLIAPGWLVGGLAMISLALAYGLIQSSLATLAFDVSSDSKGLPSALIGFGLFGGGGIGTMMNGWILSVSTYPLLWMILTSEAALFIVFIRCLSLPANNSCVRLGKTVSKSL